MVKNSYRNLMNKIYQSIKWDLFIFYYNKTQQTKIYVIAKEKLKVCNTFDR